MTPEPPPEHRFEDETHRIVAAYHRRDATGKRSLYNWQQQASHFDRYRLHAQLIRLFQAHGLDGLGELNVLDVGCGTGSWLRTLAEWGSNPTRLHGIDLLPERIERARELSPNIDFQVRTGWDLPFDAGSMNLVSAFVVFSSILEPNARAQLAAEMARVRAPGGAILIYDFRIRNPSNPDVVGIGRKEIARLFPNFRLHRISLTLAPPLTRRLAPRMAWAAHLLEAWFPFLRTHCLYWLSPSTDEAASSTGASQPRQT